MTGDDAHRLYFGEFELEVYAHLWPDGGVDVDRALDEAVAAQRLFRGAG